MTTFKDLLKIQITEIDELQRLIRNYKADGPSRKTERYLVDKRNTFAELFRVITSNNTTLERGEPDNDQDYFNKKVYEAIQKLYDSIKIDIDERLNEHEKTKSAVPSTIASTSTIDPIPSKASNNDLLTLNNSDDDENTALFENNDKNQQNGEDPQKSDDLENNNDDDGKNSQPIISLTNSGKNDLLSLQYEEMMDMLTVARDIDAKSGHGTIKAHLDNLKSTWTEFRANVYQTKADGKEFDFSYNHLLQKYMLTVGKLNDFLIIPKAIVSEKTSSNVQFSLPKIQLPEFNGKPSEWRGFIALFDRMVHNTSMDNGLKIEYLKTRIRGDASKIINHLEPTPENYMTCYALIRKRFDNKRESLGNNIENILNLPKIKKENANQLKSMHDTIYESLMSIKSLGISISNWDPIICHILTKKLDSSTLVQYECQLANVREVQSLSEFLNYLENRFMALQAVGATEELHSQNFSNHSQKSEYKSENKYEKQSYNKNKACLICEEDHPTFKCSVLLKKDVRERIELAKTKRVCLNCLSGTHKTHDCKNKYTCKTCKKYHHSLLHLEKSIKSNLAQVETLNVHANLAVNHAGSVLLATAMIGVRNKYGETIMLRALLDQGSQSAFISESAAQTLKLRRESISAEITGIGAKTQNAKYAMELFLFPRFESDFSITTRAIILT